MRQLFRRRHRAGAGLRVIGRRSVGALVIGAALAMGVVPSARGADPSIRITSPLGRTGLPGTIRIVARVDGPSQPQPMHVQFYVDKLFLSADTDGPPYDALWSDENPFEARELMVEAELPSGTMIRVSPAHICPAFIVKCGMSRGTTKSGSMSSKITAGDLPPSSRLKRPSRPPTTDAMWRPAAAEPIRLTLSTPAWRIR